MTESTGEAWARCSGFIDAALEHQGGGYTLDDVKDGIDDGHFQFWPGEGCAVVTELIVSPRLKTVNFWLLGGDLRELLRMRAGIEAWAVREGCSRAIGGGVRAIWARVLERAGYAPRWIIFSKDLTE